MIKKLWVIIIFNRYSDIYIYIYIYIYMAYEWYNYGWTVKICIKKLLKYNFIMTISPVHGQTLSNNQVGPVFKNTA